MPRQGRKIHNRRATGEERVAMKTVASIAIYRLDTEWRRKIPGKTGNIPESPMGRDM